MFCVSVSPADVGNNAKQMLGAHLVTKQTGAEGKPCNTVMICERLYLRREAYFAILMDRESAGPVMVASPAGGMDIEKVAAETPELIFKVDKPATSEPPAFQPNFFDQRFWSISFHTLPQD